MPHHSEPWPTGTPCWADLAVPDAAAAAELYGSIFGWTMHEFGEEFGNYRMALVDGHAAAGIGTSQPGTPPAWTTYVASDDAAASARAVADRDGAVLLEPMHMPGIGTIAVVADPTGAVFGLYQAGGQIGAEVVNQPGALVWTDTYVTDPEAARAFYGPLFGWIFEDVEGADHGYTTYRTTGDTMGGLGGLGQFPPGTPSHWMPYLGVLDTDAAVTAFAAAGGTTLLPAFDSPFGRMATVIDPWGATLTVISVPGQGDQAT